MDTEFLIILPVLGYFLLSFIIYTPETNYKRPWFEPPKFIFLIGWSIIYILLGFLMYRARLYALDTLLTLLIVLVLVTYTWGIVYHYNIKITIALIMISMLLAEWCKNLIFLTDLVKDQKTQELDFISTYTMWSAFVLSIVLASGGKEKMVSSIE